MQNLKRVGWHIGQPLLPLHLIAQEDSLLAHLRFYIQNQGLPFFGIAQLIWDETLLIQGVVSISKLTVVFPSGEMIDIPENGKIAVFDLNKAEKNLVPLYLHLSKEALSQEIVSDVIESEERLLFLINQLSLSTERHLPSTKASFKLAEFEKDVENRWKLNENYSPPLISIHNHPFLASKLFRLQTILENFQKELEQETATGQSFEQRTFETKLSLLELAKLRRLLLNIERNLLSHPFFLYEQISQFLDTLGLFYVEQPDISLIPYQHEKISPLFTKLIELLIKQLKPKSDQLSFLQFEKRDNCYVSEKLPQELQEAEEIFLIIQSVDPKVKLALDELRLASYARLANIFRFAVTGIPLLRLNAAPFNNNFSKFAAIFKIEKDLEWNFAITESRLAFTFHRLDDEIQAFLYWR